jgi:hypothetical protein
MEEARDMTVKPAKRRRGGRSGATNGLRSSGDGASRSPRLACGLMLGSLALVAVLSTAHPLSVQECFEGGDFIAHAAEARDNGMTKAAFNDKLLADIYMIQAFPRELRWFVQDPEDAEFLLAEATLVFDRPQVPEAHRSDFLSRCFDRKLGTGGSTPIGRGDAPGLQPPEPDREQGR